MFAAPPSAAGQIYIIIQFRNKSNIKIAYSI